VRGANIMGKYKLYTYFLNSDTGFAPCYAEGKFTLANCKPVIRRAIFNHWKNESLNNVWLAGIKRNESKQAYMVYLAKIQRVIKLEDYYSDTSPYKNRCDCIYRGVKSIFPAKRLNYEDVLRINPEIRQIPNYNNYHYIDFNNPSGGAKYLLRKDIDGNCILYSEQFVYFGESENTEDDLIKKIGRYSGTTARTYHKFDEDAFFEEYIGKLDFSTPKHIIPIDYAGMEYTGLLLDKADRTGRCGK
jgi:hypothetical protein